MLSGHTHAGQIWPFNFLVRRKYPLLAGRYEVTGMTLIVGCGTGTWGPSMRLWHPSEILRIKLWTGYGKGFLVAPTLSPARLSPLRRPKELGEGTFNFDSIPLNATNSCGCDKLISEVLERPYSIDINEAPTTEDKP